MSQSDNYCKYKYITHTNKQNIFEFNISDNCIILLLYQDHISLI